MINKNLVSRIIDEVTSDENSSAASNVEQIKIPPVTTMSEEEVADLCNKYNPECDEWDWFDLPPAANLPADVSELAIELAHKAASRFVPGEYYILSNNPMYHSSGIIRIDRTTEFSCETLIEYHAVLGFDKDLDEYAEEQVFWDNGEFGSYLTRIPFTAGTHPDSFIKEERHCGGCKYLGKVAFCGMPPIYQCNITDAPVAISDLCDCPELANDEAIRLVYALTLLNNN